MEVKELIDIHKSCMCSACDARYELEQRENLRKYVELKKEEIEKLDSIGCILAEIEKNLTKIVEKMN